MSSAISPENERFIEQAISEGVFEDRGEALNAGIELLRARKELTTRLAESRRQLDAGEYREYDGSGLRDLFEGLKSRARQATDVSGT